MLQSCFHTYQFRRHCDSITCVDIDNANSLGRALHYIPLYGFIPAQILLAVAMEHHPRSYPANLKALIWSKSDRHHALAQLLGTIRTTPRLRAWSNWSDRIVPLRMQPSLVPRPPHPFNRSLGTRPNATSSPVFVAGDEAIGGRAWPAKAAGSREERQTLTLRSLE